MTKLKARGPTIHLPNLADKGCEYHRPSCFTCPYSDCLYDMDQGRRRRELLGNRDRKEDLEIVDWCGQLVAQGVDIPAALAPIAALHGFQVRTACRREPTARQRPQVRK